MTFFSFHKLLGRLVIYALFVVLGACASKVSFSTDGAALFNKRVDLAVAAHSWSKISSGTASEADVINFNEHTHRALSQTIRANPSASRAVRLNTTESGAVNATIDASSIEGFDRVDQWLIAEDIMIEDGISERVSGDGVGVPILARLKRDDSDLLLPESGLWIPATALLEAGSNGANLRLIDPSSMAGRRVGNYPTAYDYSAPLVRDYADRQKDLQRAKALLNYEKFAPFMGMRRMLGFNPDKTAVVFVHGVFSNSSTWTEALNLLMKDPSIREGYEFWHFTYPTGAPIPFLSHKLREHLYQLQDFRIANGAKKQRVIVVGHSMGGLLAKAVTQSGGDAQWRQYFEMSPEQLDVSASGRATLRDMFYFEPVPFVDRVVFAATPHRGTAAASRPIVKLVSELARAPNAIATATEQVLINEGGSALTSRGFQLNLDFPSSIEHLQIGSDIGGIFAEIPLNPQVSYHSIIGSKRGLGVLKPEITDGIVTYTSAYLAGVESETIVESGHSLHRSPEGIKEIARVLKSVCHSYQRQSN